MPYKVELLSNEPIILATIYGQASPEDAGATLVEVKKLLDEQTSPVIHIIDFTDISLNLNDIIKGSNEFARGDDPVFHHPMLSELIFVTHQPMIQMTAKGMDSDPFGHVKIAVFDALDKALAHARGAA